MKSIFFVSILAIGALSCKQRGYNADVKNENVPGATNSYEEDLYRALDASGVTADAKIADESFSKIFEGYKVGRESKFNVYAHFFTMLDADMAAFYITEKDWCQTKLAYLNDIAADVKHAVDKGVAYTEKNLSFVKSKITATKERCPNPSNTNGAESTFRSLYAGAMAYGFGLDEAALRKELELVRMDTNSAEYITHSVRLNDIQKFSASTPSTEIKKYCIARDGVLGKFYEKAQENVKIGRIAPYEAQRIQARIVENSFLRCSPYLRAATPGIVIEDVKK